MLRNAAVNAHIKKIQLIARSTARASDLQPNASQFQPWNLNKSNSFVYRQAHEWSTIEHHAMDFQERPAELNWNTRGNQRAQNHLMGEPRTQLASHINQYLVTLVETVDEWNLLQVN